MGTQEGGIDREGSLFTKSVTQSQNVASIGFVLQIMRFDTVHRLVNRYGMPDFAQFIQMETKTDESFFGCLVHQ